MSIKRILQLICLFSFLATSCGCSNQTTPTPPSTGINSSSSLSVSLPVSGLASPPSRIPTTPPTRTEPIPQLAKKVYKPEAEGTLVSKNELAAVDYSHSDQGYVMIQYTGNSAKVKLQIQGPDKVTYTYTLKSGWDTFPLTGGNGTYTINVLENIAGTSYVIALTAQFSATLESEFLPYLYPNQYVKFTDTSLPIKEGDRLSLYAETQLDYVSLVYNYTIETLDYDHDKADKVTSGEIKGGYTPNIDEIMQVKKGICFDYAAVMATMLRTHGIPTRLEVGYAGEIYHAWVSVYIQDVGWVNDIIQFDGKSWKRMDPTFADTSEQGSETTKFITTDSNYTTNFKY